MAGVVCSSAGNHAQGFALACRSMGVHGRVYVPAKTPKQKRDRIRYHGREFIEVIVGGKTYDLAAEAALEDVARTGATLVPPFDHPDVIAGQGTAGLEIAEDMPEVANVLIPVSGGGLASGIGTAVKALCPQAQIFGVEPELAADTAAGLRAGHRVPMPVAERNRTIADGLRSEPSALTFAHLQRVLTDVLTVSESEIRSAVRELAFKAHLVSEPSGAVALAAYRRHALPPGPTVMILSGGNVEPELLREILAGPSVGAEHQGH